MYLSWSVEIFDTIINNLDSQGPTCCLQTTELIFPIRVWQCFTDLWKNWSHAITMHRCDIIPCCDSGFYWQSSLVLVVVTLLHLQHDSFLQYHLPVHIDMSSHHPQCECPSSESKNVIKYWIIKIKHRIYKNLIWKLSLWIRKQKQSTMKISDVWDSKHHIWRGRKISTIFHLN